MITEIWLKSIDVMAIIDIDIPDGIIRTTRIIRTIIIIIIIMSAINVLICIIVIIISIINIMLMIIYSATTIRDIIDDTVILRIFWAILLIVTVIISMTIIMITVRRGCMSSLLFRKRCGRLYSSCLDSPNCLGLAALIFATGWTASFVSWTGCVVLLHDSLWWVAPRRS